MTRVLGTVVVTVEGKLGVAECEVLEAVLTDLIDGQGNLAVLIDIGATIVEPEALVVLQTAARHARGHGGKVTIKQPLTDTQRSLQSPEFAELAKTLAGDGSAAGGRVGVGRAGGGSLRDEILALATEGAASLAFDPMVRVDWPIGQRVGDAIGVQLLAVLREALSNVVRHAGASRVAVAVHVTDVDLVATVTDDGRGAGRGERPGGKGLARLHHRAEALGGTLDLLAGADGLGTTVCWKVPLKN